jgi:dienelactone hydrolase
MLTKAEDADARRDALRALSSFVRVRLVSLERSLPRPLSPLSLYAFMRARAGATMPLCRLRGDTVPNPARAIARLLRVLTATALFTAGTVLAQAPEPVTTFAGAPPSGRYAFASWTPKTLAELAQGSRSGAAVAVIGHLFLPSGADKVPAVVLVHGSGGVYDALLDFWPKQFNAAGFAVFTLDMFAPRGVQSTAEDQSQVPFAADVADAFAALRMLATHPRIDARRIAIMGFSRGGTAALRTGVEKIIAGQQLPDGLRYAAIVPVYGGGCTGVFRLVVKPGVFAPSPMLFIHGDADDYTPIGPCQDYAGRIGKSGTPVQFVVIEGAHHKFDADDLRRHHVRNAARTKADCPLEVDLDTGFAYDRTTGARLQGAAFTEAQNGCRAFGATVEGSRAARDKAARAAVAFLESTFAR